MNDNHIATLYVFDKLFSPKADDPQEIIKKATLSMTILKIIELEGISHHTAAEWAQCSPTDITLITEAKTNGYSSTFLDKIVLLLEARGQA